MGRGYNYRIKYKRFKHKDNWHFEMFPFVIAQLLNAPSSRLVALGHLKKKGNGDVNINMLNKQSRYIALVVHRHE